MQIPAGPAGAHIKVWDKVVGRSGNPGPRVQIEHGPDGYFLTKRVHARHDPDSYFLTATCAKIHGRDNNFLTTRARITWSDRYFLKTTCAQIT